MPRHHSIKSLPAKTLAAKELTYVHRRQCERSSRWERSRTDIDLENDISAVRAGCTVLSHCCWHEMWQANRTVTETIPRTDDPCSAISATVPDRTVGRGQRRHRSPRPPSPTRRHSRSVHTRPHAMSRRTPFLISPGFPVRYSRAVTEGPIRVTEPLLDVLEALLEDKDHELYGWAITKATHRSSPTVYRILERLTDRGMVVARWEERRADSDRPRRRFYRLTAHGAAVAARLLQEHRPRVAPSDRPRPTLGWVGA